MDEASKNERLKKWRLILGSASEPDEEQSLQGEEQAMDETLEALYDSDRQAGLGSSSPNVNRWLGDIRKYFPKPMVQMMQKDALEQLGLKQMLMEPELLEQLEPDADLIATLIGLKDVIPDKTRETARELVRKLARQIEERLESQIQKAIRGSLHRSQRITNPKPGEIDWHLTIRKNFKHYQPSHKTIIPETLVGHNRIKRSLKEVFILTDQSGSMASSVVYAGILASVMASVASITTRFFAFDTNSVELTDVLSDPVELLFGVQLGGGTDIAKVLQHALSQIQRPRHTTLILISDLFEGAKDADTLKLAAKLKNIGVNMICLLALNDQGAPAYNKDLARQFAGLNIPSFACTPDLFPKFIAAAIEGKGNWPQEDGLVSF